MVLLQETHWTAAAAAQWGGLFCAAQVAHSVARDGPRGGPQGGVAVVVPLPHRILEVNGVVPGCVLEVVIAVCGTHRRPLFPSTCLRMGAARSLTPSRAWAHQRPQRCTPGVTCICSHMHRETMASAMTGNDSKPFWHAGGRARLLTGGSPGEAAPHRHPLISWRSRAGTLGHGARRLLGTVASPTMPSARHGARLSFALLGRCARRRPCGVCPPRPGLTCVAVIPTWGRSLACDRTGTSRGMRRPRRLCPCGDAPGGPPSRPWPAR